MHEIFFVFRRVWRLENKRNYEQFHRRSFCHHSMDNYTYCQLNVGSSWDEFMKSDSDHVDHLGSPCTMAAL